MTPKHFFNVTMIDFLQLRMSGHKCSNAAKGTAVQVLLCELTSMEVLF